MVLLKVVIVRGLTCDEVLEFPPDKKLSLQELQSLQPADIVQCLAHLGREEMPAANAEFIWKSIIQFHDGIENIPESVLMILHWVSVAVTPEEYANITFNSIDVIQNFGLNYKLNEAQIGAIATRVREDFASKEPEDYTYYDLIAIRQILCGFNRTEIERIHPSAYREAALSIGKLERCNPEAMSGFASLAVQKGAFGPIENWTDATIKIVGKVAEYLPKDFIAKFYVKSPKPA